MDENENRERTLPTKRASATHSLQVPKKRLPLGELTNLQNIATELILKSDPHVFKAAYNSNENVLPIDKGVQDLEIDDAKEASQSASDNSVNTELTRNLELSTYTSSSSSSSLYGYLHSLEIQDNRRPLANYMSSVQNDIKTNFRELLVDWLVEVAEEYKLVSDTLYLTIAYIDRFLSSQALKTNKLQLLGVSCMLIASKYEEVSPPHVEDFCYITDNTYTKEEVVDMEKHVLQILNYQMSTPTAKNFLRILTKAAQENCKSIDLQFEFLSGYLAELSLLEYGCVRYLPSMTAASAIFLARATIQPKTHPWSMALQCLTGYRPFDLKECILAIHDVQLNRKGSSLQAIRDKYKQQKFKCVATISPPSQVPAHYFESLDD